VLSSSIKKTIGLLLTRRAKICYRTRSWAQYSRCRFHQTWFTIHTETVHWNSSFTEICNTNWHNLVNQHAWSHHIVDINNENSEVATV